MKIRAVADQLIDMNKDISINAEDRWDSPVFDRVVLSHIELR
jgi:hypothetical protein